MRREGKYAMPRRTQPKKVPIGWIEAFIFILVIGGLAAIIYALARQTNEAAIAGPSTMHSSLGGTHTYDGELIRWYVFVDPDSQVQYLVNDRGGCCPRLDGFGHAIGTQYHERGE